MINRNETFLQVWKAKYRLLCKNEGWTKIMLKCRPNRKRRYGRPLKGLLNEAENFCNGLSRNGCW